MKTKLFYTVVLVALAFIACKKDKEEEESAETVGNAIVSSTDCKQNIARIAYESNQSCVVYSYDETSRKLILTHVDAAFNCCPGDLRCEISYAGDTIILAESESAAQCNCNCLFDLNMVVEGLAKETYVIKFVEPYAEGLEQLVFSIDLAVQDTGSFCVERNQYPWGIFE